MLKLILNNQTYWYRSKQSEITLKIDRELQELAKEFPCDCNPTRQAWALAILCGCSFEAAQQVDEVYLAKIIGNHPYFGNDIGVHWNPIIKYKDKLLQYIDLQKPMTVKKFYELDFLAINEEEKELYINLFQPYKAGYLKYHFRSKQTKGFEDVDNQNVYQYKFALYQYYKFKHDLLIEYGISEENINIPQDQQPDKVVLTTSEKYGLYGSLLDLNDNNYSEVEKWMDRDIRDLFKYLSYMRVKAIETNSKPQV